MNTLFYLSILLILVVSSPYGYDQLPNLLSIEARKLDSNAGTVFTVDLIHRDSLLSPQERQKRLPFGSVSRGRGRHSNPSSAYYEKKDVETDITPSGGDYLMKIAIGTPPFEFMAVADTGSDLIWLQCLACEPCIPQQSAFFDPTQSSTYQPIPCNSPSCIYPDLTSGCLKNDTTKNGKCIYGVGYGDKTVSIGVLSTDTITFPSSSSVSLSSKIFGCGYGQQGSVSNGDGIIGLGAGPLSLVSQLGPYINQKFSYCLVPRSSGASSKLKFGADLTGLSGLVSTPFVIKNPPDYYYLTLDGISIGDNLVSVGQDIIIDSGSTLTSLDTSVYNAVRDAVSRAIGLSSVSGPFGMDLCYETPQESLNPPDVVFHFKGADVALKAGNVFWDLGSKTCLAIVPADAGIPTFGNIAQVNFEVGYDLQAKQVSFAPADCTTY